MSDIPRAREILQKALDEAYIDSVIPLTEAITQALALLDRKKPAFIAPRKTRKLTPYNVDYARHLRATGMSVAEIATKLKTNGGRISEACAN